LNGDSRPTRYAGWTGADRNRSGQHFEKSAPIKSSHES
jgi:hypothetical protein